MLNLLLVGSGGFIGSALRYLVGLGAQHLARHSAFPYGTLAVNVLGCLLIGFLAGLAQQRDLFNASSRLFVFTGMLGGFTTFSTFGYDTLALGRDIGLTLAALNIFAHIALGLGAALLGLFLARWF
tara:strand:+ start:160 stop:537 length:378 start_codon:yes stop_codon:yes gene_type:complete